MIDVCQNMSYGLPYYDESNIDLLVKSDYYADEFDKEKTKKISEEICKIDNMNIYFMS